MSSKQTDYTAYRNYESMSAVNPVNGIMSEVAPDFNFSNAVINDRHMPVVPVRNIVLFPFITVPLSVTDPEVLDVLSLAHKNQEAVIALTVKPDAEGIEARNLYRIGVICVVARIMATSSSCPPFRRHGSQDR